MRGGIFFVVAYVIVEFIHAFVDIIKGLLQVLAFLLRLVFRSSVRIADMRASKREKFEEHLRVVTAPHIETLAKKRSKLLVKDD